MGLEVQVEKEKDNVPWALPGQRNVLWSNKIVDGKRLLAGDSVIEAMSTPEDPVNMGQPVLHAMH